MDQENQPMAIDEPPCVLVVAGSDSSGGAGLARDIETIAALGGKTCVAVTALTVQTHLAVRRVHILEVDLVVAQMRAALEANPVCAVKIGMLATQDIAAAVCAVLCDHPHLPVVLDPVMVSTSGSTLLARAAIECLKRDLLPLCRLVTPNLPELAVLADAAGPAESEGDAIEQACRLLGAHDGKNRAVLIKGGHATGAHSTDTLVHADGMIRRFEAPRLASGMRGTGCMLSSAIAAHLAAGSALEDSIDLAKIHVFEKLRARTKDRARG